jgi:drug/metabolite transporter (DMT)-like permease
VGYRIGLGALGLLAIYGIRRASPGGNALPPFPWRRLWLPSLRLGILNAIIPFLAISWGETYISSGDAAILNATTPLWTAGLFWSVRRGPADETLCLRRAAGLGLGFAGVAVLVSSGAPAPPVSTSAAWLGHGAVLLAAASYAVASLYARRAFAGLPPIYPTLGQDVAAALVLLPLTFLTPPPLPLSAAALGALLVLGLGGTALADLIYFGLIARVGATRTVIVRYLLPGMALIYGALLLQEPIRPLAVAGLALVLAGVAVTSRRT